MMDMSKYNPAVEKLKTGKLLAYMFHQEYLKENEFKVYNYNYYLLLLF